MKCFARCYVSVIAGVLSFVSQPVLAQQNIHSGFHAHKPGAVSTFSPESHVVGQEFLLYAKAVPVAGSLSWGHGPPPRNQQLGYSEMPTESSNRLMIARIFTYNSLLFALMDARLFLNYGYAVDSCACVII